MNRSCELQAVVVSSDAQAVQSISLCLEGFGITANICPEAASAMETLSRQKTDAFFVDHELDPKFAVLKGMRTSPSSRGALGFALVPPQASTTDAFAVADFVIDKPLAGTRLGRTLKAAYGIMLKERMRYFRHTLEGEVTLVDSMQRRFVSRIRNISQSGIALESEARLVAREIVQLQFCLPGDEHKLNCKAQVIWAADEGKAGLTFTQMGNPDQARLKEWIESAFLREWQSVIPMASSGNSATASA